MMPMRLPRVLGVLVLLVMSGGMALGQTTGRRVPGDWHWYDADPFAREAGDAGLGPIFRALDPNSDTMTTVGIASGFWKN